MVKNTIIDNKGNFKGIAGFAQDRTYEYELVLSFVKEGLKHNIESLYKDEYGACYFLNYTKSNTINEQDYGQNLNLVFP
jgi:hypothetical protein